MIDNSKPTGFHETGELGTIPFSNMFRLPTFKTIWPTDDVPLRCRKNSNAITREMPRDKLHARIGVQQVLQNVSTNDYVELFPQVEIRFL